MLSRIGEQSGESAGNGGGRAEVWGCAPSECAEGRVPVEGLGAKSPETVILVHSV